MSDRARIALLAGAVVVGLGVAAVPVVISLAGEDAGTSTSATSAATTGATGTASADIPAGPVDAGGTRYDIADAQRIACPTGDGSEPRDSELSDVVLPCLTDGGGEAEASMARALAGKPTLVNVWAWWCQPCRAELPVLTEAAERHPEWNIVGVHANGQGQAGADLLKDLDARLPAFQDSDGAFAAAAELPAVIPVSVIYRADGSRASFHPGEITSVEQLEELMAAAV
ncbi:TlpA disulfide reductase family protein [uncultured Corynebacterium sp.]|uniref:TlpA family protein disulfide reductase n=1 Tax=uncultured Corynebacterium sp. TaxID=159447 RepID=UPI0025E4A5A3|nr:TlpA disulfide reductase family protein [uncultured Corynebacterium sp.]